LPSAVCRWRRHKPPKPRGRDHRQGNRRLGNLHVAHVRAVALLRCARLEPAGIRELEPHALGVAALFLPDAGIIAYREVTDVFAEQVRQGGGLIQTVMRVLRCRREDGRFALETTGGDIRRRFIVDCGGLKADRIARMCNVDQSVQISPFRGQFDELAPERHSLIRNLVSTLCRTYACHSWASTSLVLSTEPSRQTRMGHCPSSARATAWGASLVPTPWRCFLMADSG